MLLKYFYNQDLAQASYMIGCQAAAEALIIDPARDIRPYLQAAAAEGLRISQVAETHIHADFVSGSRELASATGAQLYLSAEGGSDWQYAFADSNTVLLRDGDSWMVGSVRIQALHTPGHTPEHLMFQFTDTKMADQPMGLFTGDMLFVGDVGRPDLLEEAAGVAGSKEPGAREQFRNLQRLKALPDHLMVLPGHGAGSACGKALGAVPSSTLGYEKLFNPAFQFSDEGAFVRWLLDGQPEPPAYFARMKIANRAGPALLAGLPGTPMLEDFVLENLIGAGAVVLDARRVTDPPSWIPGTFITPPVGQFNTYAGWMASCDQPVYLIAEQADAPGLLHQLQAVGFDQVAGFFTSAMVDERAVTLASYTVAEAVEAVNTGHLAVLDVRNHSEYAEGHIPGAQNVMYGQLPRRLSEIPRGRPLLIVCAGGTRSLIALSVLLRAGFDQAANLTGGFDAWRAAGLPVQA